MKYLLFLLAIITPTVFAATEVVKVGDTAVRIQMIYRGSGKGFVHLHQNETTALKAAKYVIAKQGGSILTLVHPGGGRNVVFHLHNKRYEFDPNRIFTNTGIKKALKQFGQYSLKAHQQVKKLADKIKLKLPKGKKVIAIHNNNKSYSLGEYMPGHSLASEVRNLNVYSTCQCRNFFLVTRLREFERLKKLNFNEILQIKNPKDDGSLSVFLAKKNYINVEAGYDQLAVQVKMLKYA